MRWSTPLAVAAGATGSVLLAPVVLGAVGFTSVGIAAGSYAASMMSSAAIANGGGVAAGSLVAVLQSAGMAGLSTAASAAVAAVGGTVGGVVAAIWPSPSQATPPPPRRGSSASLSSSQLHSAPTDEGIDEMELTEAASIMTDLVSEYQDTSTEDEWEG